MLLWKKRITWKKRSVSISKVFLGSRRVIAKLARQSIQSATSTIANTIARSEIDNHADTCCFGANFTALYFTGQVCNVTPFLDEYDSMTNVEVCGAATAWDDPITGHASILEFHQGLWFGPKLPNSLINPNQCRMFGMSLCDDPFDPCRKLPCNVHSPPIPCTGQARLHGTFHAVYIGSTDRSVLVLGFYLPPPFRPLSLIPSSDRIYSKNQHIKPNFIIPTSAVQLATHHLLEVYTPDTPFLLES
jgi:hypothetical protein